MEIPKDVKKNIDRAVARIEADLPDLNLCYEFWRGNQYVHVNNDHKLVSDNVAYGAFGSNRLPKHRVRRRRNLLIDIVAREVSLFTQRVPSYEVYPATTDPEDIGGARMAEKTSLYAQSAFDVDEHTMKALTHAIVGRMGFVCPYFDNQVGDFIENDEQGNPIHTGDIKLKTYSLKEVGWDPGVEFEESRFYVIRTAQPIAPLAERYPKAKGLKPDATTASIYGQKRYNDHDLVLVTHYYERPSKAHPNGRYICAAADRVLYSEDAYPRYAMVRGERKTLDEPIGHRLSYIVDPDKDCDLGLVEHLVDIQRDFNNVSNRIIEWIHLMLNPQIDAPVGSIPEGTVFTDEPGAVNEIIPVGGQFPQPRQVPPVPSDLFNFRRECKDDAQIIAGQNDIPAGVESARAIQAMIEKDQTRRAAQVKHLARFYSNLMRHILQLVQVHYTEPRLLKISGRFGREFIPDFQGADMREQCDVVVLPGSIEPRTKAAVEQRVMTFAQMGWITGEQAMAAINGGTAEKLLDGFELQIRKQEREIQRAVMLGRTLGPDATPLDFERADVPEVAKFDNHPVHRDVLQQYMATEDFEMQPEPVKEILALHEAAHEAAQMQAAAQAAQAQFEQAAQLGMTNAAKPQLPPQNPDMPMPESAGMTPTP